MPKVTRVLGIMLALGAASAAPAELKRQAPAGTRIPVNPEQWGADETRLVMAEFARCTVKRHRELAALLVLDHSKLAIDQKYMKLADPRCLTDVQTREFLDATLAIPQDIMRFAIAGALLEEDLSSFNPVLIPAAQPLGYPADDPAEYLPKPGKRFSKEELAEVPDRMKRNQVRIAFYRYGECVARTDPLDASRLLKSLPNSLDETTAFKALMPTFSSCLTAGHQFKTNKTMMRGTLAFAYYRLARAPRAPEEAAK